jgi:RNA-directed DNA polymerase
LLKAGYVHVVDADLQSYFDTIPHDRLMAQVARKISDGGVLALIEGCLRHGVMKEMEHWRPVLAEAGTGTPQGAVISPLLANIYLHPLDRLMAESGYRMVRYADDFVILCRTAQEAEAALHRATAWVADHGLRLHLDKTRIGNCLEPGQGFDFLGYRFEAGRRLVRQKSLRALKSLPSRRRGTKCAP